MGMEPQFQLQFCYIQSEIQVVVPLCFAEGEVTSSGCVQRDVLAKGGARKGNPVMLWLAPANQRAEEGAVLGCIEILAMVQAYAQRQFRHSKHGFGGARIAGVGLQESQNGPLQNFVERWGLLA